jgi:large subunit ribosomal protein L17
MRHRHHRYRLGRVTAHRLALLRNLLVALFRHERITTTETKAKAIRPLADRIVTLAKQESLHARRQALTMVPDAEVVARLFDTIAARFSDRHGGYTRIIKSGVRRGDAAPMVFLELVDRVETPADRGKDKGDRKGRAPKGRALATGKGKKKEKAAASA